MIMVVWTSIMMTWILDVLKNDINLVFSSHLQPISKLPAQFPVLFTQTKDILPVLLDSILRGLKVCLSVSL